MKKGLFFLVVFISIVSTSAGAFASCYQADCDESRRPGSCERARSAYDACVSREQDAARERERAAQERREAAEREVLRKYEEVRRATQMNNPR